MLPASGIAADWFKVDEPPLLSLGAGVGGIFDQHQNPSFSLEYRSAYRFHHVGPWLYFKHGQDDDSYLAAGLLANLALGNRWVLTPKFGGGYYDEQDAVDLGGELQFRSELEFSYRFVNEQRLGLSLSHLSNAGTSDWNPGTEFIALTWSIPLGRHGRTTTNEHE